MSCLDLMFLNLEPYEDSYFTALDKDSSEGILWKFNITSQNMQCIRYDDCRLNNEIIYVNDTSSVSCVNIN